MVRDVLGRPQHTVDDQQEVYTRIVCCQSIHRWVRLDETLLLQVLVRLAVVDVALVILKLLHGLLLEDLMSALGLELFGDCKMVVIGKESK